MNSTLALNLNQPQHLPNYSIPQAAHYLRIPEATVRTWVKGRQYPTKDGNKTFQPLIEPPQVRPQRLSFINLLEIHILRALRTQHKIDLGSVRTALDYLQSQFDQPHPLASNRFLTDGINLFVERCGHLLNVSQNGQLALRAALDLHLDRIEWNDRGLALRLYPFTRTREEQSPKILAFDPRIAFGRLAIAHIGVPTDVVVDRYRAGETTQELAADYNCDLASIEEAIRCELPAVA
ncbi:DUF433 domain-containing protein [Geitlerinema sp. P-1104]|uniref:DUF433 domain-containing protein n=1 Tax=Geitlerinema sp. P-1104 TaxID=2546230 RepID=UPI0014772657|nr:DUF433 domain-containing protein [Geitlerinema sp. P-1104]NMG60289.1 DUF433 domain-containing protein [Geitlerinema sp. P-1104]